MYIIIPKATQKKPTQENIFKKKIEKLKWSTKNVKIT